MAGSKVIDCAQNFFELAVGDAEQIAAVQRAFQMAATQGLTKGGLDSLSAAMKNGVNMSKLIALDEIDRTTALRLAVRWLRAGIMPCQSRSFGRF